MENRRLAVLSRYLRPLGPVSNPLTASACSSADRQEGLESRAVRDGNSPDDCVFCKIIRGDSPASKLFEPVPVHSGCKSTVSWSHSLIIPKYHYSSLEETPPLVNQVVMVVEAMCSKVPLLALQLSVLLVVTHIHIIPRKTRDCLWASESVRRRPLNFNLEASQLLECVREEFSQSSTLEEIRTQEPSLSG